MMMRFRVCARQIIDGSTNAGWYCPLVVPPPFFSNTSRLTLRFSDINVQSWRGNALYDITYVASNRGGGCGGDIYNYGGQISSPMYPLNERANRDCRWALMVPQNLVVSLQFEVFDMGPSSTCANNYVQIVEVHDAAVGAAAAAAASGNATTGVEEVVRTFCGTDKPANFVSQSNRIVVRFQKTVNFAGTGWLLNFMAVQPNVKLPEY